ncbi:INO80 complex subunit E-like [Phaenicophaeus curvirostris]|uniref:INO80 complex subunit E-like n=1 Tax=Phaenicophaeus curvirostris TaxID=33595 RepID=UPI0037F09F7F
MAALNGAGEAEGGGGCKRRYRALKRRLRLLLYEQECFQEELRRAQRKLLKVSRDKSFLLDRLLQYENVDDDSSDSEATASSENSDGEGAKETPPAKRRRSASPPPPGPAAPPRAPPAPFAVGSPSFSPFPAETRPARPRPGPARRHRGSRRPTAALAPPEPPPTLPRRLLSDGPEGSDGDGGDGDNEDDDNGDDELVIDIPE